MSDIKTTERLLVEESNRILNKIMEILESDDGRSFEEKKEDALALLKERENTILEEYVLEVAAEDEMGRRIKEKFWMQGKEIVCSDGIVLRKPMSCDKEGYINIQKEYSPMPGKFVEESYYNMVWNDHIEDKALMCTIMINGEYVGYCGIKNTGRDDWEIAIELVDKWVHKGIGYISLSTFLKEVKNRLEKDIFRVRIAPDNYASQKLFEKLGARPNGISEFLVHDKERLEQCEEENLYLIDERLIFLAEQFDVEPRKLLSHVLEYKLLI